MITNLQTKIKVSFFCLLLLVFLCFSIKGCFDFVASKAMSIRKKRVFSVDIEEAIVDFFNYLLQEKPKISFFIPLILIAWVIEKWVMSFSSWLPLALAVWATIQVLFHS